jgi:hypothetical protein
MLHDASEGPSVSSYLSGQQKHEEALWADGTDLFSRFAALQRNGAGMLGHQTCKQSVGKTT